MDTCMDTNNNSKDLGDLESLVKMYKEGFLTDEEFKRAKAKILGDSDTKEKTENVTEELEKGEPESSDNSQENVATESPKAETPLEPDPSKKTASEKNINTETSDKETNKTASSNTEVKKKKNYKKLYWGIGIVAVLALSVCAYLVYLYPTQNELLCFFNQGDKCNAAGLDYQKGTDSIKKDENKALKYLEKGCELDNAESCGNLGNYFDEENEKRNLEKSFKYSKKACYLNNPDGCFNIGLMYFSGTGVTLDLNKGNEYIDKFCKLKTSTCTEVAKVLLEQKKSPKELELTKFKKEDNAFEYSLLEKACKYQDGEGCFEIGLNFVSENPEKSGEWFFKGCEFDSADSCIFISSAYFLNKNYEEAVKYADKACLLGDGKGCLIVGEIYFKGLSVSKNLKKSDEYLEKACSLNASFCTERALSSLKKIISSEDNDSNENIKLKHPYEFILLEKACKFSEGSACAILGSVSSNDKEKQLSYYQKSCEFNYALGCEREAELGDNRLHLDKNYKKSIELYTKACNLDKKVAINSCVKLAKAYFNGVFVTKDADKAYDLFDEACTNGSGESCSYLANYFYHSIGAKEDNQKYYDTIKKSCDYEYGPGCIYLGKYLYEKNPKSDSKFINKIINKGLNFCKSKCNDNDAENCYVLGFNNLFGIRWKGLKYEISPKRIREINTGIDLLIKACSLGNGKACYMIGIQFEDGFHVNKNIETANTFYRYSCENGDAGGCYKINFKRP